MEIYHYVWSNSMVSQIYKNNPLHFLLNLFIIILKTLCEMNNILNK
jgi:hypothetical protein